MIRNAEQLHRLIVTDKWPKAALPWMCTFVPADPLVGAMAAFADQHGTVIRFDHALALHENSGAEYAECGVTYTPPIKGGRGPIYTAFTVRPHDYDRVDDVFYAGSRIEAISQAVSVKAIGLRMARREKRSKR